MSINLNQVTDTQTPTTGNLNINGQVTLPRTTNYGIQVDTAAPTWGWRDITSDITAKGNGVGNPSWQQYNGTSIYGYAMQATKLNEVWINYHMPHDWVPGSDLYIHTHWSQTTADSGKNVQWFFDVLYAKGHQQQAFQNTVTTVNVIQACNATVREHMIAEVQVSTAGAIGGNTLEVDGIILVRCYRNAGVGSDTSTQDAYLHFVDMHYQSTNMATKNKAPSFY